MPTDGLERPFSYKDKSASNGKRTVLWNYASRSQCSSCHNAWSEYALAFTLPQLNDSQDTAGEQRSQLESLTQGGYIQRLGEKDQILPAYTTETAKKEKRLASPWNGSLEERARSYLHVNCAHCHRFGGGGGQVVLEMDFSKPLKETGLFDTKPRQGDFGIADARLIAPGDPYRSIVLFRMSKWNQGRMPHLGSDKPDLLGMNLIAQWIQSLGPQAGKLVIPQEPDGFEKAIDKPELALPYALAFGQGLRNRERVIDRAAKLPPGPVRDLFEGYLPPDPKGRKLGSNPRPGSILAKTGNARNGEAIFFAKENKCVNCHKLGDKGVSLGPDLSDIGRQRSRAEILDSILNPSAKVDPKFASYLVKTHDGRGFTGLLAKRDEKQLVLRDAENKEIAIAADNVEAVQPSRLSLMPDGLAAGLTPQEAADLLEFLVNLKKGSGP